MALASLAERRRDLVGIVDWRVAECRRLGVDLRRDHYVEPDEITDVDVVVVATGGLPNTVGRASPVTISPWTAGTSWQAPCEPTGDVLVYDDHGGHQALDAVEALTRSARSVEYVTPERSVAPDVGSSPAVGYFQMLADHDVRTTVLHRLVEIERRDRRLVVRLQVEGAQGGGRAGRSTPSSSSTARSPVADALRRPGCRGRSTSGRSTCRTCSASRQQSARPNPDGRFELYRVGDAVASRNIHAAILDSFRLCSAI